MYQIIKDSLELFIIVPLRKDILYLVTGNLNAVNKIYHDDKSLTFSEKYHFKTNQEKSSLHIVDFAKDCTLDIVDGNFKNRSYVHIGNESGGFNEIVVRDDLMDHTYNIEIGDMDNDGFTDKIESNSKSWNIFYKTKLN